MIAFDYTVRDDLGIHARPASIISRESKRFQSTITISKGEKSAVSKSVIGVMGLGAKKGDSVTVSVEGDDEQIAAEAMKQFLDKHL